MNTLLPYLEDKNFFVKFGALLVLLGVSFVLASIIGLVLSIPFFGMDFFLEYGQGYDYADPTSVAFLKYLQAVSQIGVFILPAFAYGWLYNRKPFGYLELNKRMRVYPLFISVLTIIVAVPAVNFLVTWNEQMSLPEWMTGIENWMREMETRALEMTNAFLKVNSLAGLLGNLLIIGLLAALGEELLFRGVILKMLAESFRNIHLAVIVSALLFSAFHGQFYGFIPRMALGMLFGYIFVWTRNLWLPIVLHFLFNSVSVVVAFLYEKGVMDTHYEDFGESSVPWVIGLSVLFTMALLGALNQRYRPRQPD